MLLDTHTLLWFLSDDENLPFSVKQQIEATDTVFASIVSLWEIAIKLSINKLTLRTPFESLDSDIAASGITIFPIVFQDTAIYRSLPLHHRDPFDRMLVAQAIRHSIVLVSRDTILDAYPIQRLWS
ncbi:type II toxin-antitoxin system VapC family toxin [Leptolyngbya sp. NIES-2104]|uniref:type II toxin-antitoxin system VapC family toxin n=1 Tax=Leptolyngbya sp. NIES-2104 TaxID=1552121 RepID=UPI0006ECCCB5|nr:type II toxin-antitoxin system VapC family toxin [Leptolyngbya sp. NIES-2104]GAP98327.1 death on curing protein, Doc toxin [Leptolyngbya sp. NIES-2104]